MTAPGTLQGEWGNIALMLFVLAVLLLVCVRAWGMSRASRERPETAHQARPRVPPPPRPAPLTVSRSASRGPVVRLGPVRQVGTPVHRPMIVARTAPVPRLVPAPAAATGAERATARATGEVLGTCGWCLRDVTRDQDHVRCRSGHFDHRACRPASAGCSHCSS